MNAVPLFRFAPSPNGRLHLGHAYSAWLNATWAEALGGRFLLRIEDIDFTRCTAQMTQYCLDDLAWLGLRWESPVRLQSAHRADYREALNHLQDKKLIYPCFCSRREVAAASKRQDPDGAPLYAGICARLSAEEIAERMALGEAPAWRLHMKKAMDTTTHPLKYRRFKLSDMTGFWVEASPERWGDAIVARRDIGTSYHLAVVADDALQGITHIVRGRDLEAATDLHVLLQVLLELPTPLYHHHALLTETGGLKLAKSRNSESLADLRQRGVTADAVLDGLKAAAQV